MRCCGLEMTNPIEEYTKHKSDLWRALPGLLISLLAIAVVLAFVDVQEFLNDVKKADYRYLPVAVTLLLLSLIARGYAWRTILQDQIGVGRAFWTINEGYLLNNVLPLRLGEIGRAFLLNRTTGIPFWEILPTIVIERIFDVAIAAGILLTSLPFVVGVDNGWQIAVAVVSLTILGFTILFTIIRNRQTVLDWYDRLSKRWKFLQKIGRERVVSLLDGASALSDTKRFLRALFWMGLTWGLTVGMYYIMLLAYDPDAQIIWALFGLGALAMGVAAPSSPGQIGVYELALSGALSLVGMPTSLALSYAVVTHVIFLLFTGMMGAYGLSRDGASLLYVYRQLRKRPTE